MTTVEIAETPPPPSPYPLWRRTLSDLERVALTVGEVLIPPNTSPKGSLHPRRPSPWAGVRSFWHLPKVRFGTTAVGQQSRRAAEYRHARPGPSARTVAVWHRRSVPAGGGGRRLPARSPKAGRHAARSARGCCARRADSYAQRASWMVASSARAAPLRAVRCSRRHPQTTL